MARKPDIQYVGQFYVYGSEARQPELKPIPNKPKTTLPKFLRKEQVKIYVDPVALAGLVVAVAMTVLMAVSVVMFLDACQQYEDMEEYVLHLQDENARLSHEYHTSDDYDLEYVEKTALALGMVPAEQVESVTMEVTPPEPEPEPTLWDDIKWFFEGLFA